MKLSSYEHGHLSEKKGRDLKPISPASEFFFFGARRKRFFGTATAAVFVAVS